MEIREILRKLITHEHMPQYDYQNSTFAFKTVFYRGTFSYCICECGIVHEYVDYVSETGNISEDLFEKVVDCITNGQCQHVANAPPEYVQEARVHALHIVAAVPGFSKEIGIYMEHCFWYVGRKGRSFISSLLNLTPFKIAILKDNLGCIASKTINGCLPMLAISGRENEKVHFRTVSFDVLCVEKNYSKILKNLLDNCCYGLYEIDSTLEAALKHNMTQIAESIVDKRDWFMKETTGENCIIKCCKLAIRFDKPNYLRKLLKYLSDKPRKFESKHNLVDCMAYANAFKRWECKTALTSFENVYSDVGQPDMSEKAKKDNVIKSLRRPNGIKIMEEALMTHCPYLKVLPISSVQKIIVKLWTEILCNSEDHQSFLIHLCEAESLKAWITSLADVNHKFMDGSFPLLDLLSVKIGYVYSIITFRSCLEV